jgi:acyl-coenzyme A synthetase/AMP-(fatty) acid ligase
MSDDLTSRMQRLSYSAGNRAKCKVAAMLEQMPDTATGEQVLTAIYNDSITATAIAAVMRSEGYDISAFSVRRHRRTECACESA